MSKTINTFMNGITLGLVLLAITHSQITAMYAATLSILGMAGIYVGIVHKSWRKIPIAFALGAVWGLLTVLFWHDPFPLTLLWGLSATAWALLYDLDSLEKCSCSH